MHNFGLRWVTQNFLERIVNTRNYFETPVQFIKGSLLQMQ